MKKSRFVIVGLLLVVAIAAGTLQAQVYTDLFDFNSVHGGFAQYPGLLVQGRDGNLYGSLTYSGNQNCKSSNGNGCGTVFKASPTSVSVLYSFDGGINGSNPWSGLTLGTDGNFYGTTFSGGTPGCGGSGCGTVFQITSTGRLTTIYRFTDRVDGARPSAPPIEGTDGNLYGTACDYSIYIGIVYQITPSGKFSTFGLLPGCSAAPLMQASDGNFYGTTSIGGPGAGTVFQVTPTGFVTVIYQFNGTNGSFPSAPLIQGADGNLYGTTPYGFNNGGIAFELSLQGTITVLHEFGNGSDGYTPYAGLLQATDGNMYGVTAFGGTGECGVIFEITPTGGYSIPINFAGLTGCAPEPNLMQHTNGSIYGLTTGGGRSAMGVLYSLNLGLGPFVRLVSNSGVVGQTDGVLGQKFTGTISVSFNGTPATFTVVSDTYLTATVPPGATTGYVTVTTPSGTLTSNVPFRVIP